MAHSKDDTTEKCVNKLTNKLPVNVTKSDLVIG